MSQAMPCLPMCCAVCSPATCCSWHSSKPLTHKAYAKACETVTRLAHACLALGTMQHILEVTNQQ